MVTKKAIVNKVKNLPQFRFDFFEEIGIFGLGHFGVVVKALVEQKLLKESTDLHFARYRFQFVLFRFAKYNKTNFYKPPPPPPGGEL